MLIRERANRQLKMKFDLISQVAGHEFSKAAHAGLVSLPKVLEEGTGLFDEGDLDYTYDWDG